MPEDQATHENTNEVAERETVYGVYNPYTHEHLYTSDLNEYTVLTTKYGWQAEGEKLNTPEASTEPVYRLYNPETGEHHYAFTEDEYAQMGAEGWNQEGIAFFEDDPSTKSQVSGDGSSYMSQLENSQGTGNNQQTLDVVQQYNEQIQRLLQENEELQKQLDEAKQNQNSETAQDEFNPFHPFPDYFGLPNADNNQQQTYADDFLSQVNTNEEIRQLAESRADRRARRQATQNNSTQQQVQEEAQGLDFTQLYEDSQYV